MKTADPGDPADLHKAHPSRRSVVLGAGLAAAAVSMAACVTAPPAQAGPLPMPSGPLRRIAFGSCLDQNKPQPVWDAILADRPDLFVFGGDNVYASSRPWQLENVQRAYEQLRAVPGFQRLHKTTPHLAIWDDHDYGSNDAGAEFVHKQLSKNAFLQFWGVAPGDARHAREGLYHAVTLGPPGREVQVIVLDCRWFRSPLRATDRPMAPGKERYLPDADPTKTMLGEVQWQWLGEQLRLPAQWRLIVSGVQVLAEGHGWECWANLPLERQRLIELIGTTRASGVMFLSGDRHVGAFYRHLRPGAYPLLEMTSSGMTHAWAQAREAGPNRIGELVTVNHYATLDFDWERAGLLLSIKGVGGDVLRTQQLALVAVTA